jgi:hypothetical protein
MQPRQPNLVLLHASAFLAIFPAKTFGEAQKLLKNSIAITSTNCEGHAAVSASFVISTFTQPATLLILPSPSLFLIPALSLRHVSARQQPVHRRRGKPLGERCWVGGNGRLWLQARASQQAINPPHDIEEIDDDSDTSPDEAMLGAEGLADVAVFISSYSTSSVKLALASKDSSGDGSDPASPLPVPASDSNVGSKLASLMVSLDHADGNNNDDVSKLASPTHVFGAGEGDKGGGKDELARDDVVGDSSGVAGSNSSPSRTRRTVVTFKMMSSSSAVGDGGSDNDKGERVEAVGDHALHIWTERDRRKKMKSVSSSLHSLLPRLPPKVSMVILIFLIICYLVNRSFLT